MSAKNCCKTMEMELTAWKAIVYDISRKFDRASFSGKEAIVPNFGDLHILVAEMDERIEQIRDNCSPGTGMDNIKVEREKYDRALVNVRMKVDEAMETLGAGSFGG